MMAFKMALRSIRSNKLRAMLTMLGIIIGVMALVVLVSFVDGATSTVTDAVSSLGSSMLTVTVSDDKGNPIRLEDLENWVDDEASVEKMSPYASESVTAKHGSDYGSITVYGVTPDYYAINNLQIAMGRFLKDVDVDNNSYVCVLNDEAATELVGYTDCVGEAVSLNGVKYTIVGVLASDEDSLMASLSSGSLCAYIPYTSMVRLTDSLTLDVTTFYVGASDGYTVEDLELVLTTELLERFEEDEDAFSVSSQNIIEDAMSSITSVLTILLGGIAAISLVVGGIGIMNIMLVTVTERTREIGIRKAIGATRGTILRQFLTEAVVLCMLGCALGIFLSWAILRVVSVVVSSLDMAFTLQGTVVLISVVFCFFIGIVFGLYPANKAAKMKPIDALHYGG